MEDSVQHFHDKLLHIGSTMNTTTAREEGSRRTKYMEDFLSEYAKNRRL